MSRRFEDNAETRRFLFGFQLALIELDIKLSARSAIVFLRVSSCPGERESYSDVMAACRFTGSQMAHAVDALIDAGLLVRSHEDADARRTHLVLTKKGRSVIGDLNTSAQSVD